MVKISKTYVPKETEKYMCAKHLAYFKLKLNEWKKDLKRSNNEAIAQASMDDNSASADIVDQASSDTEKNVDMRAINRQIKLITKIDGALKKIQDGTYGFCEDTGWNIRFLRGYRGTNWFKKINGKTSCNFMYSCTRKARKR